MQRICAIAGIAGALLLAGCGGSGSGTGSAPIQRKDDRPVRHVTVTLDGHAGPENVGILMAKKRGYFADEHLAVSIRSPAPPVRSMHSVVEGKSDFGVTQEPQLVLAKAKGAPVIAVGSLVRQSTASLIWLPSSGVGGVLDLKGKTVAIPGVPFQRGFLANLLSLYRMKLDDVKVETVGSDLVPALLSGRADAIFGGAWNVEGAGLRSRGFNPVIIPPRSLGFPSYSESMVIVRPDLVARSPGLVRDFISAVARGAVAADEDPTAAVEAMEAGKPDSSKTSRKTLEAEVEETLPLLSKSGYMDPEKASRLVEWMHEKGTVDRPPAPSELLTNEFASWRP